MAILEVMKGYPNAWGAMDAEENAIFRAAAEACAKIGDVGTPVLRQGLRCSSLSIRRFAAVAVGQAGARDAVPDLLKLFRDPDVLLRAQAIQAVGELNPKAPATVKALIEVLKDPSPQVRATAAAVLGSTNAKVAISPLAEYLKDSDETVRTSTLDALVKLDGIQTSIAPALVPLLSDANISLRQRAAECLARMGPRARTAVGALIEALPNEAARPHAIHILGKIGPAARGAVPALMELLVTPNQELRREIREAVLEIRK
jgi:HEAT repeat protein